MCVQSMMSENEKTPITHEGQQRAAFKPDIAVISKLIQTMNVAIGKASAYPEGHPLVKEAMQQVEESLTGLFHSQNQLKLGIAKNTLVLGQTVLEPGNQLFQRFAESLFRHGIMGLALTRGLDARELLTFNRLIAQSRNDIIQQGGLEQLIHDAGIHHVEVVLVDYSLFHMLEDLATDATDDLQDASFWSRFVQGFFQGLLGNGPGGVALTIDPHKLGVMLTERYMAAQDEAIKTLDAALVSYLDALTATEYADFDESTRRVLQFVQSLNSDLRRHFLEQYLSSIPEGDVEADKALSGLPDELIIEALDRHTSRELYFPPHVLNLVSRLSKLSQGKEEKPVEEFINAFSRDDLLENMHTIFREDEQDRFIPADYQQVLRDIVLTDHLTAPEISEIEQLEQTLTDHNQNIGMAWIAAELLASECDQDAFAVLARRLRECLANMFREGDYQQILAMMDAINRIRESDGTVEGRPKLLAESILSEPEFVVRVLNDSLNWIKDRKFYVSRVIKRIGAPFIGPMLDNLAEEQNKSNRMFYIDTLKELGAAVKDPVMQRLGDPRWYYVRNLLFILCSIDDPTVLDSVYRLLNHEHPRVRQELLRILVTFGDPKADSILLQEMRSGDMERRLSAVAMAGKSKNAAILEALTGILKAKGMGQTDLDLKKAAVHALAEIGEVAVLPVLLGIMKTVFWFSGGRGRQLKMEIAGSLSRYPKDAAAPILQKLGKGWAKIASEQASQYNRAHRETAS